MSDVGETLMLRYSPLEMGLLGSNQGKKERGLHTKRVMLTERQLEHLEIKRAGPSKPEGQE